MELVPICVCQMEREFPETKKGHTNIFKCVKKSDFDKEHSPKRGNVPVLLITIELFFGLLKNLILTLLDYPEPNPLNYHGKFLLSF